MNCLYSVRSDLFSALFTEMQKSKNAPVCRKPMYFYPAVCMRLDALVFLPFGKKKTADLW